MTDPVRSTLGDHSKWSDDGYGLESMPTDPLQATTIGGATITPNADGTVVVSFNSDEGSDVEGHVIAEHGENLADKLAENELAALADKVIDYVDADRNSRQEWSAVFRRGLETLGLKFLDNDDAAFPGASTVTHPLVAEAAVQFAARAIGEMFPSEGPAQVTAPGDKVDDKTEARRQRVEDYLNYYLTQEDRGYRDNWDQMLFILALHGCIFRKVWRDPVTRKPRSRFIKADKFHVPYNAEDMETTPRYTHEFTMHILDVKQAMENGSWRKIELGAPVQPHDDGATPDEQIEDRSASYAQDDDIRTLYECAMYTHLPGDDKNKPAKPYLLTMDKDSQRVLGLYRNYKESDDACRRLQSIIKYDFLKGFGFYGIGFLHIIGTLGAAAGGALRALLDAATRANLQGGFKARGTKAAGEVQITPGTFVDTDMTAEELAKAFFNVPFKGPEPALFQCLNLLVESGQRMAGTTDVSIGDAKNTGPVGTTVALIEQSQKVFSAVHARMHFAQGNELQLIYELLSEMEDEKYPYRVRGEQRDVMRDDFQQDLVVIPVSDPNISSSTQRLAIAQGILQLVGTAPQLYGDRGLRIAHKRMLQAMKVRQFDELLPDRAFYRLDPVSENQMLLAGKPVGAFQEQNHQAHLAMHMQLVQMVMQMPMQQQQQLLPPITAHIAEHVGYEYRVQYEMALQKALPDFSTQMPEDLDAMTEQRVSMMVQQAMPQINAPMQQILQMLGGGQQNQQAMQAQQHQQEMQAMQEKHQQALQQAQERHQQQMQVSSERHQHELSMREAKVNSEAQAKQMLAETQAEARRIIADTEVRTKEMVAAASAHIQAASATFGEHLKAFQAAAEEMRKTAAFNNAEKRTQEAHEADQSRKDEVAAAAESGKDGADE